MVLNPVDRTSYHEQNVGSDRKISYLRINSVEAIAVFVDKDIYI